MKKVILILSMILCTLGSFANVNLDGNLANVETVSSELMFDSCYTITTYLICENGWREEEVVIARVSCPSNQQ